MDSIHEEISQGSTLRRLYEIIHGPILKVEHEKSEIPRTPWRDQLGVIHIIHILYMVSVKEFEWMSFLVKRSVWRPRIEILKKMDEFFSKTACVTPLNWKNWIGFLMDEFFSEKACVTPQNWNFEKKWISFPMKRPVWRLEILQSTTGWVFQ